MSDVRTQIATADDLAAARERLGEAMPLDGWLWQYLNAVVPVTDAPVEFHLASGLCALSAALGNSLRMEHWGQTVYPHVWAVLVAPSSFWRKSTAINLAERILRMADDTRVFPSDFSRERLVAELSARPVGMLTLKEFGGFLSNIGREYMSGTKEMLTELYDAPDRYVRTLKKETWTIERPAVTVLAATTLDWLESRITEGDLRSGFLARFLFVTATERTTPKGLTGPMDAIAVMRLKDALAGLTQLPQAEARFTPEAAARLEEWLMSWEHESTVGHHSTDLTGFAVRLQTYAIKLAMLHQASLVAGVAEDDSEVYTVGEEAVATAIAYCRLLWHNVTGLVDDDIAISRGAKEMRRIRGIVGDGITRSDLLRATHLTSEEFEKYTKTLIETGELRHDRVRRSEVGLPVGDRDRTVQWYTIGPSASRRKANRNGHHPVSNGSRETYANGWEPDGVYSSEADGEPEGPFLSTNTSNTSLSPLSLSDQEDIHARAREELETLSAEPVVDDESDPWAVP